MNPRLRRLEADYREIRRLFDADPNVTILPIGPIPPDRYQVIYSVPSLRRQGSKEVVQTQQTTVVISLPIGYPREKPHAETADPVFHPNFGNYICIADFWAPGQSLSDIIVSIGDMLQYRKYNIRSPLNAVAAEWANAHAASLPLGDIELGAVAAPISLNVRQLPDASPGESVNVGNAHD
jgi:ubiquitin-protein ligase